MLLRYPPISLQGLLHFFLKYLWGVLTSLPLLVWLKGCLFTETPSTILIKISKPSTPAILIPVLLDTLEDGWLQAPPHAQRHCREPAPHTSPHAELLQDGIWPPPHRMSLLGKYFFSSVVAPFLKKSVNMAFSHASIFSSLFSSSHPFHFCPLPPKHALCSVPISCPSKLMTFIHTMVLQKCHSPPCPTVQLPLGEILTSVASSSLHSPKFVIFVK